MQRNFAFQIDHHGAQHTNAMEARGTAGRKHCCGHRRIRTRSYNIGIAKLQQAPATSSYGHHVHNHRVIRYVLLSRPELLRLAVLSIVVVVCVARSSRKNSVTVIFCTYKYVIRCWYCLYIFLLELFYFSCIFLKCFN